MKQYLPLFLKFCILPFVISVLFISGAIFVFSFKNTEILNIFLLLPIIAILLVVTLVLKKYVNRFDLLGVLYLIALWIVPLGLFISPYILLTSLSMIILLGFIQFIKALLRKEYKWCLIIIAAVGFGGVAYYIKNNRK